MSDSWELPIGLATVEPAAVVYSRYKWKQKAHSLCPVTQSQWVSGHSDADTGVKKINKTYRVRIKQRRKNLKMKKKKADELTV